MAGSSLQVDTLDASAIQSREGDSSLEALHCALRPFNRRWMIVFGLYVILSPRPFLEPDFISVTLVLIHATSLAWKLTKIRGDRPVIRAAFYSGMLVYGACWLMMALQIRSTVQDLFLNPYFLAPLWAELWMPLFWFMIFLPVFLSLLIAANRHEPQRSKLFILVSLWLIPLALLVYFFPLLKLAAVAVTTEPSRAQTEAKPIDYAQRDRQEAELWELFRTACVSEFEPSDAWHQSLAEFLSQDRSWFAVHRFTLTEPLLQNAIDRFLLKKYGLETEITAELAARTLDRLGNRVIDNQTAMETIRLAELVAQSLDKEQLITRLTDSHWERWPKFYEGSSREIFQWESVPEIDHLKPWIYAAWYLDEKLNLENPDQYNELERKIGRHRFRLAPPKPTSSAWRMYQRHALSFSNSDTRELASLLETGMLHLEKYREPICGGHESDEFLRRRWLWSMGPQQPFGSTKVKLSEYEMLFLDSKGGAQWRKSNRKYVLDLAQQSIAPNPLLAKSKDQDADTAMAAIANLLSLKTPTDPWPIAPHLEFLFLDHANEPRPSIAMEFWPELDSGIDKIETMHLTVRLQLRLNYLARLWPESTPQMFVDCYLDSPPDVRQRCLLGIYENSVGIPQTIPAEVQLEILSKLKDEVKQSPDGVADGVRLFPGDRESADELESIDYAIANLDCKQGAEMFLKLRSQWFEKIAAIEDDYEVWRRSKFVFADAPHKYIPERRSWKEDRIEALARSDNPLHRSTVARLIQARPLPRYMSLLETLTTDEDSAVRQRAVEVKAFLGNLSAKDTDTGSVELRTGSDVQTN
ncbi:HEAT repeat domain-containing protein [Mariniblastus fucicola]|uniref:HEAT repeat protein n=1 Tax=Mariniblastus fucicola TaxID=980251 RepID=A0A5B9P3H2_9BACT|nr:HEAT repeat domain-containing protein [Mariniblastus fucicola]QEG20734.1 hypothetical protein MFFC18_05850 [Mariniblastus fucicola]